MNITDPNFLSRSREVFRSEAAPTLADLSLSIANDTRLAATRRRDLLSALNRMPVLTDRPLAAVPATPSAIRSLFDGLSPVRCGVSAKTLANLRSLVLRACEQHAGGRSATQRIPLTPDWQRLMDRVETPHWRHGLSRLAKFCSALDIAPDAVDGAVLLGLHAALEADAIAKHPRKILKNAIVTWNRCRRSFPDWPQVVLASPFKTTPYTFRLDAFPACFRAEVEDWAGRMLDPDPLDPESPPRALRQVTVDHRILQIRQFASALVHRGVLPIKDITELRLLFVPAHFKEALRFFLDRQGGRTTLRLSHQANALRHLARHVCKVDEATLAELAAMSKRLDPGTGRQMTPRNRERLRQFDDPEHVARFLAFPERQMAKAPTETNPLRAAHRAQRALAVALMTHCGLRMATLRALELTEFRWTQIKGQGVCHLAIPGRKVKNGKPLEFELPAELAVMLQRFLADYRPTLPGAHGPYLFPGPSGAMRGRHSLSDGVKKALLQEAGLVMNPHLIRHATAKVVFERDPGACVAISRVLGHSSLDTTMAYYMGTETRAAARHVDRLLGDARTAAPSKPAKRRGH